ncbi:MAG TPA: 4Fe-4S dicluster domain-containing protein, partial [Blastocatellia bacterium]|nr:4Fe-4S dicluster domain-containing protein [Blastocatellia bacterium]
DARAYDGTVTMIQPLIAPLYHGKTPYELLAAFTKRPEESAYEVVQTYWKSQNLWADFEKGWRQAIHDGFISGSAFKPKQVELKPAGSWASEAQAQQPAAQGSIEITFRPDPSVYDGQYANNGWLQELPKPITKLTWDNAALISPNTANRLGLSYDVAARGGEHGKIYVDTVELELQGQKLKAPAWIMPGQPDDCITLHLGYGRTRTGRVGTGVGFNAYSLRASNAMWTAPGARVTKVDGEYILACTQFHHSMEGRDQVREATLAEYRNNPEFAREKSDKEKPPSLYPGFEYKDYAWGMAVDLNSCVGCNACVVACQSENNIPIVGKEEVTHGREMHWIRIDRYYSGNNLENPETHYQPVMCQQCENAPCELVCPVGATTHSAEGLNDMVYNRCVGTRYCSNNCPYKVRRFNFFEFADWETPSLKMMRNPDVTVRSRGVMEKCTYCVQRISHAKIEAEKDGRQVRDGDIATACEAACPANAITFGNINDSGSRVAKLKAEPRNYGLLADLNTRPRTTYLASVRNPNPDLEKA